MDLTQTTGKLKVCDRPGGGSMTDKRSASRAAMRPELLIEGMLCLASILALAGCGEDKASQKAEAPPPATVEAEMDANNFKVEHPEQFLLATAIEHKTVPALNVTGVVQPDIARAVPVISLASGRVVEIKARLGDVVKKGQLLNEGQSNDVSGAYQAYLKGVNDRASGAPDSSNERSLSTKRVPSRRARSSKPKTPNRTPKWTSIRPSNSCGFSAVDKDHPSGIVDILAPISGVITDQQVTNAPGVQGLGSPNPFTISDLSYVWIICDVYENDLDAVHVGEYAEIRLNAYPNKVLKGRIDNILPMLDPTIRTAKVRLEVANPGLMRVGMFATATFYGKQPEPHAAVPASAILHLHDRQWVYTPKAPGISNASKLSQETCFPATCKKLFPDQARR